MRLMLPTAFRAVRALSAVAILVMAAAFTGCSPTYNWRAVTNNASGYAIDLPAKPAADERRVDLGGTVVRMRMQTAEAGGAVFVVGTLELPDARADTQQKALAFLRTGLARNVGAAPDAHEITVPIASGGSVPGMEMQVSGKAGANQEMRTIHARLVARGARAYQVAIVADRELPPEQVDQFFQSFELF